MQSHIGECTITTASIDQMVASIQRVADTAKVLLDISQRSREEVQNGIGTMEKATDGLTTLRRQLPAHVRERQGALETPARSFAQRAAIATVPGFEGARVWA